MGIFKSFFNKWEGHNNQYSSFLLIGVTADQVIKALQKICPAAIVGNGYEEDGNVRFEIADENPDLIYKMTRRLNCRGYADTDWEDVWFVASENGRNYDGYTAAWESGCPYKRDNDEDLEDLYDAFVNITDPSGAVFSTGAGAVNSEIKAYLSVLVDLHSGKRYKIHARVTREIKVSEEEAKVLLRYAGHENCDEAHAKSILARFLEGIYAGSYETGYIPDSWLEDDLAELVSEDNVICDVDL